MCSLHNVPITETYQEDKMQQSLSYILAIHFLNRSLYEIHRSMQHSQDKWVPVTTAWHVLRLRMEKQPPIWRVAVYITLIGNRVT